MKAYASKAPSAHEPDQEQTPVLSGAKAEYELLEHDPGQIESVYILKGRRTPDTAKLMDLCREKGARFSLVDLQALERLAPGRHQGVAARLFSSGFTDFDELLAQAPNTPLGLIVFLDQVQDAGNAGALARTLYALGGAGLVIPRHNGVYLGSGARRVARGALERLPVAKVVNFSRALDAASDAGFHIYGAAMASTGTARNVSIFNCALESPAVLVLGSEESGLREQVAKRCDTMVHVPMLRDFDSLNVAQAGAIIISAFARQKLVQGQPLHNNTV